MAEAPAQAKDAKQLLTRQRFWPPGCSGERGRGRNWGWVTDGKLPARICWGVKNTVWSSELNDFNTSFFFKGHSGNITCARFHPNAHKDMGGGYIITGDDHGYTKVWACRETDQVIKMEAHNGNSIRDCSWNKDGKKIFSVGDSKETIKGQEYSWNASNHFNEVINNNCILTCDQPPATEKVNRKFRILMGGEEGVVHGMDLIKKTPYSQERTFQYVNCIRYHPSGLYALVIGSPTKKNKSTAAIIDGSKDFKTFGTQYFDFETKKTTKGNLYSCAWSPDGTQFAITGSSCQVKIYSFTPKEDGTVDEDCVKLLTTTTLGEHRDFQQSCVVWPSSDCLVSTSMTGDFSFINAGGEVQRTHAGHITCVVSLACVFNNPEQVFYSCSSYKVVQHSYKDGSSKLVFGEHGTDRFKKVGFLHMALSYDGSVLYTVAQNDTLIRTPTDSLVIDPKKTLPTGGRCRWLVAGRCTAGLAIVGGVKEGIKCYMGDSCASTTPVDYQLTSAACVTKDDKCLLVGGLVKGSLKSIIIKYEINSGILKELERIENTAFNKPIKKLSMSPSDTFVAVMFAESTQLYTFKMEDLGGKSTTYSGLNSIGQNGIHDLAWNPGSPDKQLVTCGFHSRIHLLLDAPVTGNNKAISVNRENYRAHFMYVTAIEWLNESTLITGDQAGSVALHTFNT